MEIYNHGKQLTNHEKRELGFMYYERKPITVMARVLTAMELPRTFTNWNGEPLIADEMGYIVCFNPIKEKDKAIPMHQLPQYPVKYSVFVQTYRLFELIDELNEAEKGLIAQGCLPFYKFVGVWAKPVTTEIQILGLEHKNPEIVPLGNFLALGVDNEPYHMPAERFNELYYWQRGRQ